MRPQRKRPPTNLLLVLLILSLLFVGLYLISGGMRGVKENHLGRTPEDEKAQALVSVTPGQLAGYVSGLVERVVDGDTIIVRFNPNSRRLTPTGPWSDHRYIISQAGKQFQVAGRERVRLIGVDAPETKHPQKTVEAYGKEAAAFTEDLVGRRQVFLAFDVEVRDKYGRLLAYVYLSDGTFVNAELVGRGYAQIMTVPPNVRHAELFLELQRKARAAGLGLWGLERE